MASLGALILAASAWTPVVTAIDCGPPSEVDNAKLTYNSTRYQSQAYYECLPGYVADAVESVFTCNESGYWEGEIMNCTEIDCGPAPNISSSMRDYSGSTNYMSVANYQCWSGYTYRSGARFNLTCSEINGTATWENLQNSCRKLSTYVGCYVADPAVVDGNSNLFTCRESCYRDNKTYAALRGSVCGCLAGLPVERTEDSNCTLQCKNEDTLCGGEPDLWSVYTTFDGCYFKIASEGSFQVDNLNTCREYCRGLDNLYAAYFGPDVCRCLNQTEPEATPADDVFCIEKSSPFTRVYTLELVDRIGKDCTDLFTLGIYKHGWYYLKNISTPVFCNFLDGTECKEGWLGMRGHCYFWSWALNATDMETAHSYCVSEDSLLISINDQEEANLINGVFQKMPSLKNSYRFWKMGLYDHFKTFSPQWSDGSLLSYRNFVDDQPNNPGYQCMVIYEGFWVNQWCGDPSGFICENSKNVPGCGRMLNSEMNSVYTLKDAVKMTLTLCFETCRAHGVALAAAAGDTCYCLENLPSSFVNLTWSQCSTRCAGNRYQLCGFGDPSNNTYIVAFVIEDVGQPLAQSCLDLEVQGITGPVFKVNQAGVGVFKNCTTEGVVCPTGSASTNGRCYKYLQQINLIPQDVCSEIFNAYVSVIDTQQEKEIHFGANNTVTTSNQKVWTIGLFDHQQTGFVRTSSGRARKGLPYSVGTLTPEKGPCIAFDQSTSVFVSTSCTSYPFICEKGTDYLGCTTLTSTDVLILEDYEEMSVTQCIELCRARDDTYALLGNLPFRCYCSRQKPILNQITCDKFCFDPAGQLCGGSSSLSAYTIGEFPAFATSCEDLFAEGLLVPGTYLINNQRLWCTMQDNSTCSADLSTDWLHVGAKEECFHLSQSTELPNTVSATCKTRQPSMVPASIRSEGEQTLLITLYKMLKDAKLKNPFRIGAMDQLQVGCFTWADGWLFDFAPWSTSYPLLNYQITESIDKNSYALFTNTGELINFYTTLAERRVLCREITDYVGCFIKPNYLQAAVANYSSMSLTMCKQVCIGNTKHFAAVETESCYCLTSQPLGRNLASTPGCDVPCPSNELQSCAQPGYLRVYSLNYTDVATECRSLYANFVVLKGTYLLKNTTTGDTTPTTCGLSDSTECPLGYIGYQEKCFRFFPADDKVTENATDHCVSVGG